MSIVNLNDELLSVNTALINNSHTCSPYERGIVNNLQALAHMVLKLEMEYCTCFELY